MVMNQQTNSPGIVMNQQTNSPGMVMNQQTNSPGMVMNQQTNNLPMVMNQSTTGNPTLVMNQQTTNPNMLMNQQNNNLTMIMNQQPTNPSMLMNQQANVVMNQQISNQSITMNQQAINSPMAMNQQTNNSTPVMNQQQTNNSTMVMHQQTNNSTMVMNQQQTNNSTMVMNQQANNSAMQANNSAMVMNQQANNSAMVMNQQQTNNSTMVMNQQANNSTMIMNQQANNSTMVMNQQRAPPWQQNRGNGVMVPMMQHSPMVIPSAPQQISSTYERVPPLHPYHSTPLPGWTEDNSRKKTKAGKQSNTTKKHRTYGGASDAHNHSQQHRNTQQQDPQTPCPNIDVRQLPVEHNRPPAQQSSSSGAAHYPSFMEDPSGYLAQQTALLNSTISRQTGVGSQGYLCHSPTNVRNPDPPPPVVTSCPTPVGVPLPSNVLHQATKGPSSYNPRSNSTAGGGGNQIQPLLQNANVSLSNQTPTSIYKPVTSSPVFHMQAADSSVPQDHCQGCVNTVVTTMSGENVMYHHHHQHQQHLHPIQTEQSRLQQHDTDYKTFQPAPSQICCTTGFRDSIGAGYMVQQQDDNPVTSSTFTDRSASHQHGAVVSHSDSRGPIQGETVSTSNGSPVEAYSNGSIIHQHEASPTSSSSSTPMTSMHSSTSTCRALDAVASSGSSAVISSSSSSPSPFVVPHVSPSGLYSYPVQTTFQQQQHAVVCSSPGMTTASTALHRHNPRDNYCSHVQEQGRTPKFPAIVTTMASGHTHSTPMMTSVTAAMTQVIPAVGVAQQVPTVLVNALPAPLLIQPGVMTMDGMTGLNQNTMQIPHLTVTAGNMIHSQHGSGQLIDPMGQDPNQRVSHNSGGGFLQQRPSPPEIAPGAKKKATKKRKVSQQTVASMLHIASQQQQQQNNSSLMMQQPQQQSFTPQQGFTMSSPHQGITTTGPMLQALTIVPGKPGAPAQILMNGQPGTATGHFGAHQLITTPTSQQPQQINLLQPVNLLNSATGVVQNFPAFQQFIVPGLGGMVMATDGTTTILPDTSNIGVQLQLQNVNGQNVLTPVQSHGGTVFGHHAGQSILAAGPAGMVIRAPTSGGKMPPGTMIQQQNAGPPQFLAATSPTGHQFLMNSPAAFGGQLSPLVANVSPNHQMSFTTNSPNIRPATSSHHHQQDFIQCGQMGQTLMVPCSVPATTAQNTTVVQQNTTIVQQHTTMVSNNQQLLAPQQSYQPNANSGGNATTLNIGPQNFFISNNNGSLEKTNQQQAISMRQLPPMMKHSVSTQTAAGSQTVQMSSSPGITPGALMVATNTTFCQTSTGSPPDTTTHSPVDPSVADGRPQSPAADTTTHSIAINMSYIGEVLCKQSGGKAIGSSRRLGNTATKKRHGDTAHSLEEEDDEERDHQQRLSPGDLVWGSARGYPAWPGKLVGPVLGSPGLVSVRWFGGGGESQVAARLLKTLSEGLEAHHAARTRGRKSRKLNSQLEKAIQEAMGELDRMTEPQEPVHRLRRNIHR
uniref:PWWP domain-containing protein n=1 Tax=Timema genevievae TaxID=629358 RepID=A0A7R9PRG2_TIMGE|nr:unnamed protein product [Timema genevievae]